MLVVLAEQMLLHLFMLRIGLATVCPWPTNNVASAGTPPRLPAACKEASVGNPTEASFVSRWLMF
ncbi:hypothetical protein CPA45_03600 [Vreelandella nigrificans]|uniref:Uncharacterized protein n=1 Tax=Vreelandella nigrificans TaxID=2042704 RepID=A0A2A4HQY6_9GAMM|nr:hypothetical protein CPA45_03600 [Halomonas nigrificans]